MEYVPSGTLHIGPSDQDVNHSLVQRPKQISIQGFFMDDTEITNNEYRQFVHWVRDSIASALLARKSFEANLGEESENTISEYAFKDADTSDISEFTKYMRENYYDLNEDPYFRRPLDMDQDIEWSPEDYEGFEYIEVMDSLYLPPEIWHNGEMKIDVNRLIYKYSWFDAEAAALDRKRNPTNRDTLPFIKNEEVEIYPDTTVWIKDFNYSYNEPMHNDYFSHPAYCLLYTSPSPRDVEESRLAGSA